MRHRPGQMIQGDQARAHPDVPLLRLQVLLPHARTKPTDDVRPINRRAETVTGMNHNGSPRHQPAQGGTTRMIAANVQWHDADLGLKVARHSFDSIRAEAAAVITTPAHGTNIPTQRR
jgi:hypothetical protein